MEIGINGRKKGLLVSDLGFRLTAFQPVGRVRTQNNQELQGNEDIAQMQSSLASIVKFGLISEKSIKRLIFS
jgi:hypothetical protein